MNDLERDEDGNDKGANIYLLRQLHATNMDLRREMFRLLSVVSRCTIRSYYIPV